VLVQVDTLNPRAETTGARAIDGIGIAEGVPAWAAQPSTGFADLLDTLSRAEAPERLPRERIEARAEDISRVRNTRPPREPAPEADPLPPEEEARIRDIPRIPDDVRSQIADAPVQEPAPDETRADTPGVAVEGPSTASKEPVATAGPAPSAAASIEALVLSAVGLDVQAAPAELDVSRAIAQVAVGDDQDPETVPLPPAGAESPEPAESSGPLGEESLAQEGDAPDPAAPAASAGSGVDEEGSADAAAHPEAQADPAQDERPGRPAIRAHAALAAAPVEESAAVPGTAGDAIEAQAPGRAEASPQAQDRVALRGGIDPSDRAGREHLARVIFSRIESGGGRIGIRLQPPSLGTVDVDIAVRDGRARIEFRVESPTARQLLAAGLRSLESTLQERGVEVVEMHVWIGDGEGDGNARGWGAGGGSEEIEGDPAPERADATAETSAGATGSVGGRLDFRA